MEYETQLEEMVNDTELLAAKRKVPYTARFFEKVAEIKKRQLPMRYGPSDPVYFRL